MQQLGTDRSFVQEQYSDADRLRIRIETHERYSQDDTERILDNAVQALCLSPGVQVLDVGCGAGGWHPRIAAAGATIVGVDLMPGMIREAQVLGASLEPPPVFAQGDAQALPFGAATFDRVLCAGVLYHVPDVEHALREMRRVLRPGGRAVISTNGAYAMRRIYELHACAARELGYEPLPITAGHFTMDDLHQVEQVFPSAERHVLEGALVFKQPSRRYGSTQLTASMPYVTGQRMAAIVLAFYRQCGSRSMRSSNRTVHSRSRRAWGFLWVWPSRSK